MEDFFAVDSSDGETPSDDLPGGFNAYSLGSAIEEAGIAGASFEIGLALLADAISNR